VAAVPNRHALASRKTAEDSRRSIDKENARRLVMCQGPFIRRAGQSTTAGKQKPAKALRWSLYAAGWAILTGFMCARFRRIAAGSGENQRVRTHWASEGQPLHGDRQAI
jgi:hypothetical protein